MEANNPKEVNTSKGKNEAVRLLVSGVPGDPSLQAGGSWFGVATEPWEELPVVPGPHPESVSSLSSHDLGHTQPHLPSSFYFTEETKWRPGTSLAMGGGMPGAGPSSLDPDRVTIVIF